MAYHIMPVNDLEPHEKTTTCKCEPTVKYEDGKILIIHNSFDGRELFEEINEYLNKKTMYIINQYDDLSLMGTPKEKFTRKLRTESRQAATNKMNGFAGSGVNGNRVLIQVDGEVTIILQIIENKF